MRSPDHETLDPQLARELEMLEAELGADLQTLRPTLEQEFASMLDERAASGFPGSNGPIERARRRLAGLRPRRALLPALAATATAIVVGTVVASNAGSGEEGSRVEPVTAPKSAPAIAARPAPRNTTAAGAAAPPAAVSGTEGGLLVPAPRPRRVERSADLTLGTDPEHVRAVSGGVFTVVRRYDGIVLSSSVRDGTAGLGGASFRLLIPSFRLGDALLDLSRLAEVRSRNEGTLDITKSFVTVQQQLRDARADANSLTAQLAGATTRAERDSLDAELRQIRSRIAHLRDTTQQLQRRSSFSRVSVEVTTGAGAAALPGSSHGGWTLGDAVHDAGKVLSTAAGVTLVGLAVIVPFALLGGLAWAAWRVLIKRSREGALG